MGWGDAVRDSGRPIVVGVAAIGAGVVRVATGMVKRSIIAGVIATLSVSLGASPVVWLVISLLTAGGAAYPLRRWHKRAVDLRAREVAARWGPERQKEAAAVAVMVALRARRDDERRRGAHDEQRDATMAARAPWASPAPPAPSVAAPDMAGEVFAARRHLYQGLYRYVDDHLTIEYGPGWTTTLATTWRGPGTPMDATKPDLAGLRRVLIAQWGHVFAGTWPQRRGTLDDLHHLRDARNRTSHEDAMPPPDAYRAVALMLRLLRDIEAPEADAVARLLATIEAAD